jgi:succinate-semialdehyde dehydrogenase/glutarate-semialdehyde dehydrogenase
MAGNAALLKHAPNVLQCAAHIERIFIKAGFPEGIFQNLVIEVENVADVIKDPRVKAVTLTGSERAGTSVASLAGRHIKKTVLELGGSNAFVVLKDADLELALDVGVKARMLNCGQSCIAAKRFILEKDIAKEFITELKQRVESLKLGDPLDPTTQIGPLARVDLAEQLEKQVQQSTQMGATLLTGGSRTDAKFVPAILTGILPGMPAFEQELFGPVASVLEANSAEHALDLANHSRFGLGASVFTKSPQNARMFIENSEDGAVFINDLVMSDPRLPFGGTISSGYGRELSMEGIREFVNIKTIYIKDVIYDI